MLMKLRKFIIRSWKPGTTLEQLSKLKELTKIKYWGNKKITKLDFIHSEVKKQSKLG